FGGDSQVVLAAARGVVGSNRGNRLRLAGWQPFHRFAAADWLAADEVISKNSANDTVDEPILQGTIRSNAILPVAHEFHLLLMRSDLLSATSDAVCFPHVLELWILPVDDFAIFTPA